MEEKTITVGGEWNVCRKPEGIYIDGEFMGSKGGYARDIAHAILELIGEPVPGKVDHNYIAVRGESGRWTDGTILNGCSDPTADGIDELSNIGRDEYHIFRRVATVGPIPQPERKVTRYE